MCVISCQILFSTDIDDLLWFENTSTPFHLASWQGHLDEVKWLAERIGYQSLLQGFNGWSPLHAACYGGNQDIALYLISECQCDPSFIDDSNVTPLHVASFKGHLTLVKDLIHLYSADPSIFDCCDNSILHYAALGGSLEVVAYLIEDVKMVATGRNKRQTTPYLYACESGNLALVEYFRHRSLFNDDVDRLGRGPAFYACRSGSVEMLEYLSKQSENVNWLIRDNDGCGLLSASLYRSSLDLVKYLIQTVGEHIVAEVDHTGRNYSYYACSSYFVSGSIFLARVNGCFYQRMVADEYTVTRANWSPDSAKDLWHLLQYFVSQFPNSFLSHSKAENSRFSILLDICLCGNLRLARYLIEELRFDPHQESEDGSTVVHYVCRSGSVPLLQYLTHHHQCSLEVVDSYGNSPLHYACKSGFLSMVQYLVEVERLDVSARNKEGLTPFEQASLNGQFEISVYLLMKHHCKLHVASGHLNSLNFACQGGNVSLVEYLLSLDLTPATGKFGRSALHDAAMYGRYPLVKLLIKRGVSPCITSDDGSNALHAACSNGHKHIAQYLVKVAPELVITKTKNGSTPLHRACEMGHMHVACYFIQELGVNPNAQITVPVLVACESGNLELVKFLITDRGCDPWDCDSAGNTSLHYACKSSNLSLVKFLVDEYNLDPMKISIEGIIPLHVACEKGRQHIAEYLIEKCGCDPNYSTFTSWTPLHYASKGGHCPLVKFLVSHYKCDIAAGDADKKLPLHVAAENGRLKVVKYLTGRNNCNVNAKMSAKFGAHCLHMACVSGCLPLVQYMIEELQLNPKVTTGDGAQPIHAACVNGHLQVVKYLVENNMSNCDPEAMDTTNLRPLHYAALGGNVDVVEYLSRVHRVDITALGDGHAPNFTPAAAAIQGGSFAVNQYFNAIIVDYIIDHRFSRSNFRATGNRHHSDLL